MKRLPKQWLVPGLIAALVVAGAWAGWRLMAAPETPGLVSGNGRIEATEIDVATKLPGRVIEILVNEGDFVKAGQPLARGLTVLGLRAVLTAVDHEHAVGCHAVTRQRSEAGLHVDRQR